MVSASVMLVVDFPAVAVDDFNAAVDDVDDVAADAASCCCWGNRVTYCLC